MVSGKDDANIKTESIRELFEVGTNSEQDAQR